MIEDTIAKIEKQLASLNALPADQRAEMQALLAQLRHEASTLPGLPGASAGGHAGEEDARAALERLRGGLAEFEASHPKLTEAVNRVSTVLSNMGI